MAIPPLRVPILPPLAVVLDGLTISGGTLTSSGTGGGIFNRESLNLSNSTVSGNSANYYGGGIYNHRHVIKIGGISEVNGILTITNTYKVNGILAITNSTVSGNSAGSGGGIENGGTLTITNSTVSGNSAYLTGGGITNRSTLTITNSTVSGNTANYGGGGIDNTYIYTTFGNVSLVSTIVADNIVNNSTPDIFNSGSSSTVTARKSLIENGTITNDLGGNITGRDPLLDPKGLQNNGGATQTIALLPGSPAINAGSNPNSLTTDQRGEGFARTSGGGTDIGAYEFQVVATIYQHGSFGGNSQSLGVGRYNINKLGIGNDTLSSLKVDPGYKITLYEYRNFEGKSRSFTSNTSGVGNFDDLTTSIVVEALDTI